jgi:hypothetical protein
LRFYVWQYKGPMKLTTIVVALLLIAPAAARAQRLQLDHLDRLAAVAGETVNITIDPDMLKMAGGLLGGGRQNDGLAAMLDDLQGIYIRSFEFEQEHAYAQADVDVVRKQLAAPGWSRLLEIDGKQQGEQVQIYSWREGNESGGLAIVVAEPKELTVVNIVGKIDLARLGALQGQFGIPQLPDVPGTRGGR